MVCSFQSASLRLAATSHPVFILYPEKKRARIELPSSNFIFVTSPVLLWHLKPNCPLTLKLNPPTYPNPPSPLSK